MLSHNQFINFFNSTFFFALITLVVGTFVFFVYWRRRLDKKRDASNILLLEIEGAEQQLQKVSESLQKNLLPEDLKVLPVSSWADYRYMFVRNFDRDEWDKLTLFYSKCEFLDEAIAYNKTFFQQNEQQLRINLQAKLASITKKYAREMQDKSDNDRKKIDKEYIDRRKDFINLYGNVDPDHTYFYQPIKPVTDAKNIISTMDLNISTSSIGIKLKKMARRKTS